MDRTTCRHYYTILGGFISLLCFFFFYTQFIKPAPAADFVQNFATSHKTFDESFVAWSGEVNKIFLESTSQNISPYSPEIWERVKEEWLKREVGEKFRKMERSLEGVR